MFAKGFKAMLPIVTGVIPFGLVMGTVSSATNLTFLQCLGMNVFVFAGAAQLASVDLMGQQAAILVVLATGLIINLRMMLYSAALSGILKDSNFLTKALVSYCVTDQSYAVLVANENKLDSNKDRVQFYLGSSLCMVLAWQIAVVAGFFFGNFAPPSISLEFAVPLSFVCLTLPTIKNNKYLVVTVTSSILSIVLKELPFNLGLLTSALIAIAIGAFLSPGGKA